MTTNNRAAVFFEKIIQGDRIALGQAMTMVESERSDDRQASMELLASCGRYLEDKVPAIRFAVSGAPGVGKSTLLEAIGKKAVAEGQKVGVITVDPSSSISHGSILGDKARMTSLSVSSSAFVRSSAAGTVLGGIGRRSHELMTLLAAGGYDLIFMETVGVGQSEHTAWQFTDGFILVIQPGGGDELQGIKRGITELADIIIVNKADGHLADLAGKARSQYQAALHFFTASREAWSPKIVTCSALEGTGIDEIWQVLRSYQVSRLESPVFKEERRRQSKFWLSWSLGQTAHQLLINHPEVQSKLLSAQTALETNTISPFTAEFEIEQMMKNLMQVTHLKKEID